MIAVLIAFVLCLSLFCSIILNRHISAILLVVLASCQMSAQSHNIIIVILFTVILHFLNVYISVKRNKSFLLISFLPTIYILVIFLIQPYKINIYYYLGYLVALFIFAWVALIEWDTKKIIDFLTVYGLYLILMGFAEKALTGQVRVGAVLTVATAYAVVLVTVWTIWIVNVFLNEIYSKKMILLGTFLVFLAIIFSGTRMGLLGIFMGLGLCGLSTIFMKSKNINIIKIAVYSIGVIILLLLLTFIVWNLLPNDLFIKKTFSTLIQGKLDGSNLGRVFLWVAAIDIIEQNKLLGIGAGNFPAECKVFFNSIGVNRVLGENTHAHNIYLIMLSEHGIIGFVSLMTFAFFCIFRLFLNFIKNRNSSVFYAFLSGLIIMALLGLVDATPMYLPTVGFAAWFFGVCASFNREKIIC